MSDMKKRNIRRMMRRLKAQLMDMVSGESDLPPDSTILSDSATHVLQRTLCFRTPPPKVWSKLNYIMQTTVAFPLDASLAMKARSVCGLFPIHVSFYTLQRLARSLALPGLRHQFALWACGHRNKAPPPEQGTHSAAASCSVVAVLHPRLFLFRPSN